MASSEMSSSDDKFAYTEVRSRRCEEHEFSEDEEDLIWRMYKLVGERWSLISGRIPGRSAEEIQKYCTTRFSNKDVMQMQMQK